MAKADRHFIMLRGDEVRPFVQVTLRQSDAGPQASVHSAGRPCGFGRNAWPEPGDAAQVLDTAFDQCQRAGIVLRVVLNDVEWDKSWGRLVD